MSEPDDTALWRVFSDEGIRFECQETGQCCMSRGEYGYVYLTRRDRDRMAEHFGLTLRAFTARHCTKTDGHYHLNHPEHDCQFLEHTRCSVYQARPMQCRTWPFWPENLTPRAWARDVAAFCPGVGKGPQRSPAEVRELLRASGCTEDSLVRLERRVRASK